MDSLPNWPTLFVAALCVVLGAALLAAASLRGGCGRRELGVAALCVATFAALALGLPVTPWALLLAALGAGLTLLAASRGGGPVAPLLRPRVVAGIALSAAWLGLAAAVLVDSTRAIPPIEESFRSEPITAEPLVQDAVKNLTFGDVIALPGWWGDFELSLRVRFDGPSALEVRLRSPAPDQAAGVVLFIGEDPVFRTGFARESATRIERIGSQREALSAQLAFPERRLRIRAHGDRLEATIDGVDGLVAQANDATFRSGRILLTPVHGNVRIDEVRVRPEPQPAFEPPRGGVRWGWLALVLAVVAATLRATERTSAWAWSSVLAAAIGVGLVLARHESTIARTFAGQVVAFAAGAAFLTSLGSRGSSAARTAHLLLACVVIAAPFLCTQRDPRALFSAPPCEVTAFQGDRSEPRAAWRLHSALRAAPEFVALRRIGEQPWSAVEPKGAATLVLGEPDALIEASPWFKALPQAFVLPAVADPWALRALLLGPAVEPTARGVVVFAGESLLGAPTRPAAFHLEPEAGPFRATVPWLLRAEYARPRVPDVAEVVTPLAQAMATFGVPTVLVVSTDSDATFAAAREAAAAAGVTALRGRSSDLGNQLRAALESKPR